MQRRNELLVRVYLVLLFFLGFTVLIIWRVVNISLIEGDRWREEGGKYMQWMPVEAERGNIYAEDGALLATSIQFFEIRIDPAASSDKSFYKHIDSLSYYLSRYADRKLSQSQWKDLLVSKRKGWYQRKEKGSRNVLIASKVNYQMYRKFSSFPLLKLGPNSGGLIANRFSTREKPFKDLANRTIGMDRENASKIGLEEYYDEHLKGEIVQKLMKRIPPGHWIPIYDPTESENKRGDDIVTTLDMELQDIVHNELMKALSDQNAKAGTTVIMDVKSGAIKAISNLDRTPDGQYMELYNRAIGTQTEPGSTFKLATILALLEDGHATPSTKVDLMGGRKKFYDQWMEDSERHGIRETDMATAFKRSSNVGMATLAHRYYGHRDSWANYVNRLRSFGLGDKTGVDISGEPVPFIKDPLTDRERWYGTTIPWMAHGYELMLTPLQVLNFYNAVANGGKLMKPYLVKEIVRDGKPIEQFEPVVLNEQIASPENVRTAKELLEGVVLEGTAQLLKAGKYSFAGKTGTTRTNYSNSEGVAKRYNSSFVGFFPADEPQYSIIVVIYEPKRGFYGSSVAGPVFRAIADRCFAIKSELSEPVNEGEGVVTAKLPDQSIGFSEDYQTVFEYLDMEYTSNTQGRWVSMRPEMGGIKIEKIRIRSSVVPDVRGMGVRDAIYVLENLGLLVEVHGIGKVKQQTILPGTKINGQTIDLYLN